MTACATSPIPVSENFPLTVQPKVRLAGHWDILSKDVIVQTLDTGKVSAPAPLYVTLPPQPSAFDRAFRGSDSPNWFRRVELSADIRQRAASQLPNPGGASCQPKATLCAWHFHHAHYLNSRRLRPAP